MCACSKQHVILHPPNATHCRCADVMIEWQYNHMCNHFFLLLVRVCLRSLGLCFQLASAAAAPLYCAALPWFFWNQLSGPYSGAKASTPSSLGFLLRRLFNFCIRTSSRRMGALRCEPPCIIHAAYLMLNNMPNSVKGYATSWSRGKLLTSSLMAEQLRCVWSTIINTQGPILWQVSFHTVDFECFL